MSRTYYALEIAFEKYIEKNEDKNLVEMGIVRKISHKKIIC
jgi:hypothetical protein